MGDSRQRIDHRPDPQPQRRADRHFDQAEENQHDRRIFNEIGVRPHPSGQQHIPRVAVQKLRAHADSRAAHRQPEIDERTGRSQCKRDRQQHGHPPIRRAATIGAAGRRARKDLHHLQKRL
jgi:hypothetical protein